MTEVHTGLEPYENDNIFKVAFVLMLITFNVVDGRISTFIALQTDFPQFKTLKYCCSRYISLSF